LSSLELRIVRIIRIIVVIIRSRSGPVADWFAVATVINHSAEEETGDWCTGCEQDAVVFNSARVHVRIYQAEIFIFNSLHPEDKRNDVISKVQPVTEGFKFL
jgi:hypothetical protein